MNEQQAPNTFFTIQLQSINKEAENTYTFTFPIPEDFSWKEGACVHFAHSQFDISKGKKANKDFVRHLSISSLPDEGVMSFTTRIPEIRSGFKQELLQAKPGDSFSLFKPENRLELKREGKPIILISAGVGIAATRTMIRAYVLNQKHIPSLLHINIDSSGMYLYQDDITQYECTTQGLTNIFVNSRDDLYQELAGKFLDDAIYYIVGGDEFLFDVSKWLMSRGISISSIILDKKASFYDQLAHPSFTE